MTETHCSKCDAVLPSSARDAGACPACGATLDDAERTLDVTSKAKPAEAGPKPTVGAKDKTSAGRSSVDRTKADPARSAGDKAAPDETAAGRSATSSSKGGGVDRTVEAEPRPAGDPAGTARSASGAGATGGAGGVGQKPSLVGQEIGGCRVVELVGTGAMGAVYAATQIQLDRKVALKIIHPELWQNERVLKRFQLEAKAVGKLSSPHVVQIHQVGFENGVNFLVMEFVAGGNLRTWAARQPEHRITSADALKFMRQCVLGLKEAETNGILHRDIKPDNLLLDKNGDVKIADFGLAKTLGDRLDLTASSDLMGTPLYMSPEQCRGDALDFRSDMYSLGAAFYYLLTAQPPVEGKTIFEVLQTKTKLQCLSPAAALPELSGAGPISRVIERMTALEAADRYASYDDLLADLDRLDRGEKVERAPQRRKPEAAGSKVGIMVALVVFLAAVGGGLWHFDPFGWRVPGVVEPVTAACSKCGLQFAKTDLVDGLCATCRNPVDPPIPREAQCRVCKLSFAISTLEGGVCAACRKKTEPVRPSAFALWQIEYEKMRDAIRASDNPTESDATLAKQLLEDMPKPDDERIDLQQLLSDVRGLVNDIGAGSQINQALRTIVAPKTIQLPFTDVEQHVAGLEKLLAPESPGPELQRWVKKWRKEYLEDPTLPGRTKAVLDAHWAKCRDTDLRGVTTEVPLREFERDLQKLRDSKVRLCQVFPGLKEPIEAEITDAGIAGRETELANRRTELALLDAIATAHTQVRAIKSVANWVTDSKELSKALSSLRTRRDELVALLPAATDGLDAAIEALKKDIDKWSRLESGLALGVASLGRGEVGDAKKHLARLASLSGEEPELGRFRAALDAVDLAVLALSQGKVTNAEESIQRAREEVVKLGVEARSATVYLDAWRQRLGELRDATADMVAVPTDKVELGDGTEVEVKTFFIDRYEASRADFRRFLNEVAKEGSRAAVAFTTPAARARALELLPDLGAASDRDSYPMDNLCYEDALAYLRWRKKAIPRLAEWWLVAKGPVGKATAYPWGDSWSDKPADRNATMTLVKIDAGGRSARFQETPVHHLAGNVAEWLEADPGKTRVQIIGGHFRDEERGHYSGKSAAYEAPAARTEGIGCRGVLRVADFVADLLPK